MTTTPELGEQVADALAPTEGRHRAEQLRQGNDAALLRLQQQGYIVSPVDVVHLHVAVLLDVLFGDLDDPQRQAYEIAVHTKLADLLGDVSAQVARAKLLEGIPGIDAKAPRRATGR